MRWQNLQRLETEHPGLVTGASELVEVLGNAESHFGSAMVDYTYTDRLVELADQLDAAGMLVSAARYATAFTVLRTALEHALTDSLLFNATKRRARYVGVSAEWEAKQREAWKSRQPGTEDIESIERRGQDVYVIRAAYPLTSPDGAVVGTISPYAVAMSHHSPFIGKKADQADRWQHVGTVDERRAHAETNREWWDAYLSWSAIKSNLELNGIYSERDTRRLDVHYGFLSAFTHAHDDGYRIAHKGRPPAGGCHFCSELGMLYLASIAAIEVSAAVRHCTESDAEFVNAWAHVVAAVEVATRHLWFPPGTPSEWDRHREVMQRQFESRQWTHRVIEPYELDDDDIPYYGEPMSRLVGLHSSGSEMTTGLTYRTPWPQPGPWTPTHP